MISLLLTGITLIGPFTGQFSETFENHVLTTNAECMYDRAFNNHADICQEGNAQGFGQGDLTISNGPFTTACCTTTAHGGTHFLWTQTTGTPASRTVITFDEPVVRFGMNFAHWNCSTGLVATFFSEDDTLIATIPLYGLPACVWNWSGFDFGPNLPCKRVELQNSYWFGIELDDLQMDFAPIQPGMDTCFPGVSPVIPCPCGNQGLLGRGCANSSNIDGAHLTSAGNALLAADTLVFTTTGQTPSGTGTLIQMLHSGYNSSIFGQGVICGYGGTQALCIKDTISGSIVVPGPGDPSISAMSASIGFPLLPGMGRSYAVVYNDRNTCPNSMSLNVTQTQFVIWK